MQKSYKREILDTKHIGAACGSQRNVGTLLHAVLMIVIILTVLVNEGPSLRNMADVQQSENYLS
jgi:hypothetical protein